MSKEEFVNAVRDIGLEILDRAEEIAGSPDKKMEVRITATISPFEVPSLVWESTVITGICE